MEIVNFKSNKRPRRWFLADIRETNEQSKATKPNRYYCQSPCITLPYHHFIPIPSPSCLPSTYPPT